MTVLTFNVPDAAVPRVLDAFITRYNYKPFLDDGVTPNPETEVQFTRRMIREYIIQTVIWHEAREAANAASAAKEDEIREQVQVT